MHSHGSYQVPRSSMEVRGSSGWTSYADLRWKRLPRKSTQKPNTYSVVPGTSKYTHGVRYRYARDRADMYSSRTGGAQRARHTATGGWATGGKTHSGGISGLFVLRTTVVALWLFFRPTSRSSRSSSVPICL